MSCSCRENACGETLRINFDVRAQQQVLRRPGVLHRGKRAALKMRYLHSEPFSLSAVLGHRNLNTVYLYTLEDILREVEVYVTANCEPSFYPWMDFPGNNVFLRTLWFTGQGIFWTCHGIASGLSPFGCGEGRNETNG